MADNATPIPDPQLEAILDVVRQLLAATTVGAGDSAASPQLDAMASILSDIRSVAAAILDAMGRSATQPPSADSPQPIPDAVQDSPQLAAILEELKKLYHAETAVTAKEVKQSTPGAGGLGAILGALSSLLAVVTGVVAALLAVAAITQQFVGALDPGLIEQFGRAFKDLQATIGVAFTGIFEQGMNLFRGIAAAVQPIFAALKPIVDQLVGVAMKGFESALVAIVPILDALLPLLGIAVQLFSLLSAVLRPLSAMFSLLTQVALAPLTVVLSLLMAVLDPLVRVVGAVMDGFTDLINTFSVVLRVLIETLTAFIATLFGGSLQETVKVIGDAFKELVTTVLLTAAKFALLIGATDFVKRLHNAFDQTGENAVGATSIKGLEQIGKDMALAAVNAVSPVSAADVAKVKGEWRKRLTELIPRNKKNTDSIVAAIMRKVTGSDTAAAEVAPFALDPVGFADPF